METTGELIINADISRLNGKRLAIEGATPNPIAAATKFLAGKGLNSGRITVTGRHDFIGSVPVIFMTDARPAQA